MALTSEQASELAKKRWKSAGKRARKAVGQLRSTPTPCPRCGRQQPSWRAAQAHCRVSRATKCPSCGSKCSTPAAARRHCATQS